MIYMNMPFGLPRGIVNGLLGSVCCHGTSPSEVVLGLAFLLRGKCTPLLPLLYAFYASKNTLLVHIA